MRKRWPSWWSGQEKFDIMRYENNNDFGGAGDWNDGVGDYW